MMIIDFTEGATHYHADYVNPRWASQKDFIKTVQIDTHRFYRWQG
jgi:spore germination cell wall hydrolase CwlJ-like protein